MITFTTENHDKVVNLRLKMEEGLAELYYDDVCMLYIDDTDGCINFCPTDAKDRAKLEPKGIKFDRCYPKFTVCRDKVLENQEGFEVEEPEKTTSDGIRVYFVIKYDEEGHTGFAEIYDCTTDIEWASGIQAEDPLKRLIISRMVDPWGADI